MNKAWFETQVYDLMARLFALDAIERVIVKDIPIASMQDTAAITQGIDACWHDCLSDVDAHLWLNERIDGLRLLERLGYAGQVLGMDCSQPDGQTEVIRCVLCTGLRMDLICHRPVGVPATTISESSMFWFRAVQALGKLLRGDYLISAHLAHMLLMEGLVRQMAVRDEAHGTNFHRYGYREALAYRQVDLCDYATLAEGDDTFRHIAENLLRAICSYAKLNRDDRIGVFIHLWERYREQLKDA